jgi:hypothetical protein
MSTSQQPMPDSIAPMLAVSSNVLPKDSGKVGVRIQMGWRPRHQLLDGKKLRLQMRRSTGRTSLKNLNFLPTRDALLLS